MLNCGDVVDVDLGVPDGSEAGFSRPAVVITAQRLLDGSPSVVQVIPLTTTIRGYAAEVVIEPTAENGLKVVSAAQAQHIRAVSVLRASEMGGNVGSVVLRQIRTVVAEIIDVPA